MNLPSDFIPITSDGMSVISALVFFPMFAGVMYLINRLGTRADKQDKRIDKHSDAINSMLITIAEFKGDMRETRTGIQRIDEQMTDIAKTYRDVLIMKYGSE